MVNSITSQNHDRRFQSKKIIKFFYYENIYIYKRLNFIKTWCKIHIILLQSQHATSFYHIFKNKHNHTQSII